MLSRCTIRAHCAAGVLLVVLASSGGAQETRAQTATVRGFVTAREDGEAMQGVNVVLDGLSGERYGTVTDGDGVYDLSVPAPGRYRLRASFVGYGLYADTLDLQPGETWVVNVALTLGTEALDEVRVEAEGEGGAARVTAGLQSVRVRDVERVPSPDVSGDLASFLTTLPGIVTLGDRGGQLYVRGGEPSHNLVLLDGMYVFQPFHVLGFYSAFPADIIDRADVYAAGHGSAFTGRIASVIDVYARNGNKRRYEGAVSMAPFVSAVRLEGPLLHDRISFLASARRSVVEQVAARYVAPDLPYRFGDVFGKVHAVLHPSHRLSVSALHTHDRGTLGAPSEDQVFDEVRWSNTAVGLRYLVLPRRVPFWAEILLSASYLRAALGPEEAPVRVSEIDGFNYAVNMTNFIGRAEWHWGLFWRVPEIRSRLGGVYQNVEFGFARRHKAGLYVEPDFIIGEALRVRVGLVGQLFPSQSNLAFLEPRLRVVWQRGRHEVSGAAGGYHQEIFGLHDRRDATSIFTAWRSAPTDALSRAMHVLAGYRVTLGGGVEVAAEGFYKRLRNLYIEEWTSFPRFTSRLQRATGRVAGVDLRLEVRHPAFYGYVTYGLSSVRYEARQASLALWYGTETLAFRPPHDRRHQVNALVSVSLAGFDLSLRWNYGSGRPYSRLYGFDGFVFMDGVRNLFETEDEQRVIYERPFEGLLPSYHRLDVSVERAFGFRAWTLTVQAGAINVYNRRNIFALDTFTQRRTDQLPFIPTLGVEVAFP